jgi:hypothetical protein
LRVEVQCVVRAGQLATARRAVCIKPACRPSELIEFTVDGRFIAGMSVDPSQGAAVGLAFGRERNGRCVLPRWMTSDFTLHSRVLFAHKDAGGVSQALRTRLTDAKDVRRRT